MRLTLAVAVLASGAILSACSEPEPVDPLVAACEAKGGTLEYRVGKTGTAPVCTLADGSEVILRAVPSS
ncbi:hypothetical protein [Oceanomicrobium pacificus]|uniref:DUF333 domain-containing protein n=1 Tax=Oceanomicrobium pacificus TaxID=2692916 RepID=A0A6B0TS54_9RHOB|nr:hypothetical protein [Oceanomicrobium pacificus]MXU66816.1 hypothetical protein [Oceanomicrobium pacificus]